jgi:beta-glucosidase
LEGIKALVGDQMEVAYSDGKDLQQVTDVAKNADVVIVVTGNRTGDEGEFMEAFSGETNGGDRDSLSIAEEELLMLTTAAQANKHCIVVLEGGSAIMMEEWKNRVPAILMMWYAGMEGGHALANILFGKVNPSGKMPLTIPSDPHQLPYFNKNAEEIEYGYYHGYTLFDKKGYEAAFPFGFGLSYTQFEFSGVKAEVKDGRLIASVNVTNTGKMAGEEVVQLYVGFENSAIDRPVKVLKGFKKVALDPGQTKTVQIEVENEDLAYYDTRSESWQLESMDYQIYLGSSSKKEDLLATTVRI